MGNIFLAYYYREDDINRFDESLDILFSCLPDVEQRPIYYYRRGKNSIYHNENWYFKDNGISILN